MSPTSETGGTEKLTQEFPRHIPDHRTETIEMSETIETSGTENPVPVSSVEETRTMTPAEEKEKRTGEVFPQTFDSGKRIINSSGRDDECARGKAAPPPHFNAF